MEHKERLIITPKTKLMQLLEAYPELEEGLIDYLPAFKKLQNPILRKTVARIATLQQVAATGEVSTDQLINHLRKEVGQDRYIEEESESFNFSKPKWFKKKGITEELDAREMLAAGEHPVNQVMADLQKLESNKIYKLTVSFLPAPLIDKAKSIGFEHWADKKNDDLYEVYFYSGK